MPQPRDASVVLPTRDKAERLRLTLATLAGHSVGDRLELVIVDDGSRDGTRQVLEEAAAHLPLVVVDGRGEGRASARNLGARRATAGYLIFLDDDILVGDDFVAAHLGAAAGDRFVHGRTRELITADRLVADLAGASYSEIRGARDRVHGHGSPDRRTRLYTNALERAIEGMVEGILDDVAPWLGCVGANVSMYRDTFLAAGGFDESFGTTWGCEDLELGFRLHHAGVARGLAPEALGVHLTHRRSDRWDQHDVNLERFRALHPEPSVCQIAELLNPRGNPESYAAAVRAAS